jgi:hypothetical protein
MMEFLAANFNLPTIIVGAIVFGGVGWITWHSHKHGGCSGCSGGCDSGCSGSCSSWLPLSNNGREGGAGQGFGPRPLLKIES